jgi:large subunit ribosomal protein L19
MPDIRPGHIVKVYQKIFETKEVGKKMETKERIQVYEGLVIAMRGRKGINATITVRKISDGVGVERIYPLNSPAIEKIELIKTTKARRAKLYYMRDRVGKATQPKGELIKKEEKPKAKAPIEAKKEEKAEAPAETKAEVKAEAKKDEKVEAKTEKKE